MSSVGGPEIPGEQSFRCDQAVPGGFLRLRFRADEACTRAYCRRVAAKAPDLRWRLVERGQHRHIERGDRAVVGQRGRTVACCPHRTQHQALEQPVAVRIHFAENVEDKLRPVQITRPRGAKCGHALYIGFGRACHFRVRRSTGGIQVARRQGRIDRLGPGHGGRHLKAGRPGQQRRLPVAAQIA